MSSFSFRMSIWRLSISTSFMALIFILPSSRSLIFSMGSSNSTLEAMKLMRNSSPSMFLMAKDASLGRWGESLMICRARSLMEPVRDFISLSFLPGRVSSRYFTLAKIYGSDAVCSTGRRRLSPWSMAVMVPSGISMIFMMRASVPILYRSMSEGSSTLISLWAMAPRILPDV